MDLPPVRIDENNNQHNAFYHSVTFTFHSFQHILHFISFLDSAGEDYVELRAELTLPAGESELAVQLQLLDDSVVENNEFFLVHLSSTDSSVTISTPSANVTILEDDSETDTLFHY